MRTLAIAIASAFLFAAVVAAATAAFAWLSNVVIDVVLGEAIAPPGDLP